MFKILESEFLAPDTKRFTLEAPRVARKHKAGQFVILRVHSHGERIPLTVLESDPPAGTISLVVKGVGRRQS
jgi:ferredoxin--NADP+ reductase